MDEKPNKQRKNRTRNAIIDIVTLFVIATIAIVIFVLVGRQSTTTSTSSETVKIVGLHCERDTTEGAIYFERANLVSGLHEVGATFSDDNLQDIMYSYIGVVADGTNMEYAKTVVHADFDLDLGNSYVHGDGTWSEAFSVQGSNSVRMSVSSNGSHLSSATAHVFGLPKNSDFPTSLNDVRAAYEDIGYTCIIKD